MTITYVGGKTGGGDDASLPLTVSLTDLTGGSDSAPAADDLVVVTLAFGYGGSPVVGSIKNASSVDYTTNSAYGGDARDCTCCVGYRLMPGTPETSVVLDSASSIWKFTYTIHVYRGVSTSSPMDATATTADNINTMMANPPAITPVTFGAWIHVAGAAGVGTADVFTSSPLTAFLSTYRSGGDASVVGAGYFAGWSYGAYDPAAFTSTGPDNADFSWAAVTLALRPAVPTVRVGGVFFGSNF